MAVLVAAAVGAFMAWQTLRQKAIADDRAEWWKRTQWALDNALDQDEDTRALGLAALEVLAGSELARNEEIELLDIAWKSVTGPEEPPAAQHLPVKVSSPATASQHRVQVAAARLRVTLDRRLGRRTPDQTKARAKEDY
jgi:hypothetical protein